MLLAWGARRREALTTRLGGNREPPPARRMSVQALSWVFDRSEARGSERLVLLSIANHADQAGRNSWPAQATIAREANLSETRVKQAIRALVEAGVLLVEGGAGGSRDTRADRRPNRYTIVPLAEAGDRAGGNPGGKAGGSPGGPAPTGGTRVPPAASTGGRNGPHGGHPGASELPTGTKTLRGPSEVQAARDLEHARNEQARAEQEAALAAETDEDREAALALMREAREQARRDNRGGP